MIIVRAPLPPPHSVARADTAPSCPNQDEKAVLSDLACMLLSNMTKLDSAARDLIALRIPFQISQDEPTPAAAAAPAPDAGSAAQSSSSSTTTTTQQAPPEKQPSSPHESEFEIPALDLLLEVFLKGDSKKYNPNATYDFLASVFANVSLVRTSPVSGSPCAIFIRNLYLLPHMITCSFPPAALSSSRQRTDPPNLLSRKSSPSPNIHPRSDAAALPRPSSKCQ